MIKRTVTVLFYIVAVMYFLFMLNLLFRFDRIFEADRLILRAYNLIPFHTIWEYASGHNPNMARSAVVNVIGNVAVFVPYGLFLQVVCRRKEFSRGLSVVGITTIVVELIQFVFGLGVLDIDDVLLNCLGGAVGILTYKLLIKLIKDEGKTNSAVMLVSVILGAPLMYVLLFRLKISL